MKPCLFLPEKGYLMSRLPLWYERWRRFGNYRVVTAAARWLAVASREERPEASEDTSANM